MLHHYALSPRALDWAMLQGKEREKISLLEFLRGTLDNGMITLLKPPAWFQSSVIDRDGMSEEVRDMSEDEAKEVYFQKQVIQHLTILFDKNRLILPSDLPNLDHRKSWSDLVKETLVDYNGIIVCEEPFYAEGANIIHLKDLLDHSSWWNRKHRTWSRSITQSESTIKELLSPILRHAKRVHLIDPYFTTNKERKYNMTLDSCLELIGGRNASIILHVGCQNNDADPKHGGNQSSFMASWHQKIKGLHHKYSNITFEVRLWSKKEEYRFHDRYVLTDQCGIVAPGGLEPHDNYHSVWCLLDSIALEEVERIFEPSEEGPLTLVMKNNAPEEPQSYSLDAAKNCIYSS